MKVNYQIILDKTLEEIVNSKKKPKLLLHSCCAPCSSYVLSYLSKYFKITIYYYNPNIDEEIEFIKRSEEQIRLIKEMNLDVDYVIEKYNNEEFQKIAKGHEEEKEGGARCFACYGIRLDKTAIYAKENGYDYFTTTLSISPYKNSQKLNEIGIKLEELYGIKYLQSDFKKKNGYKISIELSHKYGLYRQDYCGCKYSKIEHEQKLKERQNEENKEDVLSEQIVFQKQNIKIKKPKILALGILLLVLIYPTYILFAKFNDKTITIETQQEISSVNELYFYGNHFNIKGNLKPNLEAPIDSVVLSFVNRKNTFDIELSYSLNDGILEYYLSDKLNTGYMPDNIEIGDYDLFLKIKSNEKDLFYVLDNKTKYKKTQYYTLSNQNKKIVVDTEDKYNTLEFNITKNNNEVYDIVLDPGHGGNDSGACLQTTCETKYTLEFANILKKKLESAGLKVKLTRDTNETLKTYGTNSRTGIPYEAHAKYVLSLHMNAGAEYSGFEFYTSNNIDYSLANKIVTNLNNVNDFTSSPSTFNRVTENGIFTRTMSDHDLEDFVTDAIENNYEQYIVDNSTNYYYMIRETGGYMSGAYVDGREGNRNNPYVLSNVGSESYILELGYITSTKDQEYVNNYKKDYLNAVGDAIISYLGY